MCLVPKWSLKSDFPLHCCLLCNSLDIWMLPWAGILDRVHQFADTHVNQIINCWDAFRNPTFHNISFIDCPVDRNLLNRRAMKNNYWIILFIHKLFCMWRYWHLWRRVTPKHLCIRPKLFLQIFALYCYISLESRFQISVLKLTALTQSSFCCWCGTGSCCVHFVSCTKASWKPLLMAEERTCGFMERLNCPVVFKDACSEKQGTVQGPFMGVWPYLWGW